MVSFRNERLTWTALFTVDTTRNGVAGRKEYAATRLARNLDIERYSRGIPKHRRYKIVRRSAQ